MLARAPCSTAPYLDQPYTGPTLAPTIGKPRPSPMTQSMCFVAFASALGITFGGLQVRIWPIWKGSDHQIQGIRDAARRSGWPRFMRHRPQDRA